MKDYAAIKDILANEGIETKVVFVTKNGQTVSGLTLLNKEVSPIVYFDDHEAEEEFAARAKEVFQTYDMTGFDINDVLNPEYLKKNSFVCIQKPSTEDILKKRYLDLEVYARVRVSIGTIERVHANVGTIKITHKMLEVSGITEAEFWDAALANTRRELMIISLGDVFGTPGYGGGVFNILTTQNQVYGAAGLAFPDIMYEYCMERHTEECYILPSSIHEVLLVNAPMKPNEMADLVRNVNSEVVVPEEQLLPTVYKYTVATNSVAIVTSVA